MRKPVFQIVIGQLLGLGVAYGAIVGLGAWRWSGAVGSLLAQLDATRTAPSTGRYNAAELEGLPAPVQRYFRAVLTDGQRIVTAVTLTQTGTFNAASLLVDSGATAQLDSTAQIATTGTSTVNGTLDVTLGGTTPMLTAADATLNTSSSVLNISGYSGSTVAKASDLDAARTVVIHTTGGITGDFSAVEGIGEGNADYIVVDAKKSTDGNDYSIGSSLAWNAVAPLSSGIFTLTNASDAFDVDVVLADQAANGLTWDGQSLTKLG